MDESMKQLIIELRRKTVLTVLQALDTEPTAGWAQVARGILNDYSDLLTKSDEELDESTLDMLNDINTKLKFTGTDG